MGLADYDTSVEKIAALKCAMLDPASVSFATTDFTADDVLYVISIGYADIRLNNWITKFIHADGFNSRINNGDVISGLGGEAIVYVKDSDIITYDNPIELYQNRLARILETDVVNFGGGSSVVAGTYGSLLVYPSSVTLSTGERIAGTYTDKLIPVPAGQQINTVGYYWSVGRYFDVPSDW